MANAKIEALRWILSKPLVPLAKKIMGGPVTLGLPSQSIANASDDMTNVLQNLAHNSLMSKTGFKPTVSLPHSGLDFTRKTSTQVPVSLLTGKSNKAMKIPNTRKVRGRGLPRSIQDANKMTEDSARLADNNMINSLYDMSTPAGSEFTNILNSLSTTHTPDYAQAAYKAVPWAYPLGGLALDGLYRGSKSIYDYIRDL